MNWYGDIPILGFGKLKGDSETRRGLYVSFHQYCILLLTVLCMPVIIYGTTYSTISNGAWNNESVWSTDGTSGCLCTPPTLIDEFDVIIGHTITLSSDLHIKSGNKLTVNVNSALVGDYNIYVEKGEVISNGTIEVGLLEVSSRSQVTLNGKITISKNFVSHGSAILNALVDVQMADFENEKGAKVTFTPNSRFKIRGGNFNNAGMIKLDSACFQMSGGDFDNLVGGTVRGVGAITVQAGDIKNSGNWSLGVDWCVTGSGTGLPQAENCAGNNCADPSTLPFELAFFEGNFIEDHVILTWQTVTESNSDYFTVERRHQEPVFDIPDRWEEIEVMPGAGNSNTIEMHVNEPQIMHFAVYDLRGNRIYEEAF